jgi:hypothetical protein
LKSRDAPKYATWPILASRPKPGGFVGAAFKIMKFVDTSGNIGLCAHWPEKPLPRGIRPAELSAERFTGKQELLCIVPN